MKFTGHDSGGKTFGKPQAKKVSAKSPRAKTTQVPHTTFGGPPPQLSGANPMMGQGAMNSVKGNTGAPAPEDTGMGY